MSFTEIMESRRIETMEALAKAFEGKGLGESKVMFVPHVSDADESLVVRCGGGYLVTYPTGDPGCYSEVGVDFVSDDGYARQLAVVGRDEDDGDWPYSTPMGYQRMHVDAFEDYDEPKRCYIGTDEGYYNYVY